MNGCQSKDQLGLLFRRFQIVNTSYIEARGSADSLTLVGKSPHRYKGVFHLKPTSDSMYLETFPIFG